MKLNYKGRQIEVEIEHGRFSGVDSFFSSGCWLDTLEDLTDAELDDITEKFADELCDAEVTNYGYFRK